MVRRQRSTEKIEIKSERARRVLGQIPPWIIRSGIQAILLIFLVIVFVFSWIKINPVLQVEVLVKIDTAGKMVGRVLLPQKEIQSSCDTIPITFENRYASLLPPCRMVLGQKRLYLKNDRVYQAIEIIPDTVPSGLAIEGSLKTYGYVGLAERSVLAWLAGNLFDTGRLVLSAE